MKRVNVSLMHVLIAGSLVLVLARYFNSTRPAHVPLWSLPKTPTTKVAFVPQASSVLCIDGLDSIELSTHLVLTERDVDTGKELRRCEVDAPKGRHFTDIAELVGNNRLLVHHGIKRRRGPLEWCASAVPNAIDVRRGLIDLWTAKSAPGPFTEQQLVGAVPSPLGKWFLYLQSDVKQEPRGWEGICRVVSTVDARVTLLVRLQLDCMPSCIFSPDESLLAVLSHRKSFCQLEIYDVASGQPKASYSLANSKLVELVRWEGNRLFVREESMQSGKAWGCNYYTISMGSSSLGPIELKPLLRRDQQARPEHPRYWSRQPLWVGERIVRLTVEEPEALPAWVQKTLGWGEATLAKKLRSSSLKHRVTIEAFEEQSGALLHCIQSDLCKPPFTVSPDGRRVVSCSWQDTHMFMWDLDPKSRFPWFVLVALAPSLVWIGSQHVWRRRQVTLSRRSTSPPCGS